MPLLGKKYSLNKKMFGNINTNFFKLTLIFISLFGFLGLPLHATPVNCDTLTTSAEINQCYKDNAFYGKLQIFSDSPSPISTTTQTLTLSLGLGDPIFTGLKRSRDKFIHDYLDVPIGKIEKIRDKNIQRFNLKSILRTEEWQIENDLIATLKSIFGLDDMSGTLAQLKAARLNQCREKRTTADTNCRSSTPDNSSQRSSCLAIAASIEENCFKITSSPTALANIRQQLIDTQNLILDRIASVSLVNSDPIMDLRNQIKKYTSVIDDTTLKVTEAANMDFGVDIQTTMGTSINDLIKSTISSKFEQTLNLPAGSIGVDVFTGQGQADLLNFRSSGYSRINDLCDLTKCLAYPKSKRGSDDYRTRCIEAGYTGDDLNRLVNEMRQKLTLLLARLIIVKLFTEIAIQEKLNAITDNIQCAIAATQNTIGESISSSLTDYDSLFSASNLINSTNEQKESLTSISKCLSQSSQRTRRLLSCGAEIFMQKQAGIPEPIIPYVLWGQFNAPFISDVGLTGKCEQEGALIQGLTANKEISACVAEGKTKTWLANYEACKSGNVKFKLDMSINPVFPALTDALRLATKASCESNFSVAQTSQYITLENVKSNTSLNPPSADQGRWEDLKTNISNAKRSLFVKRLAPSAFPTTKEGTCAKTMFNIVFNQQHYVEDISCTIIDPFISNIPIAPILYSTNLHLEDTVPAPTEPVAIIPSVIKLCNDSSKLVYEHFTTNDITEQEKNNTASTSVYNPTNTRSFSAVPEMEKFKITRAISNIAFCDNFFFNIANMTFPIYQKKDNLINANSYKARYDLFMSPYTQTTSEEYKNSQFQETITMLNKRSQKEKFHLCITKPTIKSDNPIDKAIYEFCKSFKIELFDVYYHKASRDLNMPLIGDDYQDKIDKYIDKHSEYFQTGAMTYD